MIKYVYFILSVLLLKVQAYDITLKLYSYRICYCYWCMQCGAIKSCNFDFC